MMPVPWDKIWLGWRTKNPTLSALSFDNSGIILFKHTFGSVQNDNKRYFAVTQGKDEQNEVWF